MLDGAAIKLGRDKGKELLDIISTKGYNELQVSQERSNLGELTTQDIQDKLRAGQAR